jgi:hypothetical protein
LAGAHLEDSKTAQLQSPFTGESIADAVKHQLDDLLGFGLSDFEFANDYR